MMHLTVNLTSLAAILWSGMLIIAGSIWVLSSQVRKLVDLLEVQAREVQPAPRNLHRASNRSGSRAGRAVARRVSERAGSRIN